jgi:hypothetical protein
LEGDYKAYVEGHYFLQLLEARMDKATKASPAGGVGGSRTTPFVLDPMTPAQRLGMIEAQNKGGNVPYFMDWNGRRLAINGRLYVFDDGKVGPPAPTGEWNEGVPPTYRELARQVVHLKLNQIKESQKFSQKLRRLFENPSPGSRPRPAACFPRSPGRCSSPSLAGTGAPGRSTGCWWILPIRSHHTAASRQALTWDKILWHPAKFQAPRRYPLDPTGNLSLHECH